MTNKPMFFVHDREGKASLWIETGIMRPHNIWDIPHNEVTPSVLAAIVHAYEIGRATAKLEIGAALDDMQTNVPYSALNWHDARQEATP